MRQVLLAAILLALSLPLPTPAQPFELHNGYIRLEGDNGAIDSLRLDATGQGAWGPETIAAGGAFAFSLDGVLLRDAAATAQVSGNRIDIGGLPGGATGLTIQLDGNTLTAQVRFNGTKVVRHDWPLVWLDAGFYHRGSGLNYAPDQSLDLAFESFFNPVNGNFRSVEMLKRLAGQPADGNPSHIGNWPAVRCRARAPGGSDAVIEGLPASRLLPEADRLTLRQESSASYSVTVTLRTLPKDYAVTLDDGRHLPEFYVLPEREIRALADPAVTQNSGDLLTEFFQHLSLWWGDWGNAGGIWTDYAMITGCFTDTPYRDVARVSLEGWITAGDGYGNPGRYAYTWGGSRGWPFPEGRDSRHFNTNAIFLTALGRYLSWTGDTAFLQRAGGDRTLRVHYDGGATVLNTEGWNGAPILATESYGQSFEATAPFSAVSALTAVYGASGSGCRLTLREDGPEGAVLAQQSFSDMADNAYLELGFASRPAGRYYLEMDQPVGTVAWWGTSTDTAPDGYAYLDGWPDNEVLDKARELMQYQQQTLLAAAEKSIVTGTNIGTSDHLGRNGDLGGNYYDILPFGYHDALTDIYYYLSVRAMADIEDFAGNAQAARDWRREALEVRERFNTLYWREGLDRNGAARYAGCVDVNGTVHDYGFSQVNTMALAAGLGIDYPARAVQVFDWLDHGESYHGPWSEACVLRIGYADGEIVENPEENDPAMRPIPLPAGGSLEQQFFAWKPFTSVAAYNPTWTTSDSDFRLTLLRAGTGEVVASREIVNAVDNAFNELEFDEQPEGYYILRMSELSGVAGWWASPWSRDIYSRWLFTPRVSNLNNAEWWQAAVGGNPEAEDFAFVWDDQLQNGGADLYESGYDVWARAQHQHPDRAWERLEWILRRYLDPDRLGGSAGFYGEGIQGGYQGAGSVGWMFSEFPETGVLGAAFFRGFFGARADYQGLRLRPVIPAGHGITHVGARHISYMGATFDLEADADSLRVQCTANPENQRFHFSNGQSAEGLFTRILPLDPADGTARIAIRPILDSAAGGTWWLFE